MLSEIENLDINTEIEILFIDGKSMIGKYKGYTEAEDNEPNVSQIDIEADDGTWYGIDETEIKNIEKVQ